MDVNTWTHFLCDAGAKVTHLHAILRKYIVTYCMYVRWHNNARFDRFDFDSRSSAGHLLLSYDALFVFLCRGFAYACRRATSASSSSSSSSIKTIGKKKENPSHTHEASFYCILKLILEKVFSILSPGQDKSKKWISNLRQKTKKVKTNWPTQRSYFPVPCNN